MATKEVAQREAPQVPALHNTPALTITAEDIALPRIYFGQFMSKAVQDGTVKMGQIYAATGADDPDPAVLFTPGGDDPGVLFHVLGLIKRKSFSQDGELESWDFNDPDAPAEAWTTYNYTLVLPDYDSEIPFKLLLTKSSRPAALNINTVLVRGASEGPMYRFAFRLKTAIRENSKGRYAVAQAFVTEAQPEHVELAAKLASQMSSSSIDAGSTGETPAI